MPRPSRRPAQPARRRSRGSAPRPGPGPSPRPGPGARPRRAASAARRGGASGIVDSLDRRHAQQPARLVSERGLEVLVLEERRARPRLRPAHPRMPPRSRRRGRRSWSKVERGVTPTAWRRAATERGSRARRAADRARHRRVEQEQLAAQRRDCGAELAPVQEVGATERDAAEVGAVVGDEAHHERPRVRLDAPRAPTSAGAGWPPPVSGMRAGTAAATPRRAERTVLCMSMAMVMGPTPPGTGVSQPATGSTECTVDVTAQLARRPRGARRR